jgi:CRISPR-associated endonuclease Cas2
MAATSKKKLYYKGIRVNSLGLPIFKDNPKKNKDPQKRLYNTSFASPFKENSSKNLIVMYDIPHEKKKERDWFRRHLVKFGYVMIQKSVWVGPSPLPKVFLEYVKEIEIGDGLKTFKLAKDYKNNM